MATNNVFNLTKISQKERAIYSISQFRGVDYLNNPMNVADNHAIDMKNFIMRDGVNQKRFGTRPVFSGNNIVYADKFIDENGEENIIIFEERLTRFNVYIKKAPVDDSIVSNATAQISLRREEVEGKISTLNYDGKLYIFTGKRIFILENNELVDIGDKAYIPTIFKNIQEESNDVVKSPYDDFNLIQPLVKVTGKTHSLKNEDYEEGNTKKIYKYKIGTTFNDLCEWYGELKEKSWGQVSSNEVEQFEHYRDIALTLNGETLYLEYSQEGEDVDYGDFTMNISLFFRYDGNQIAWLEEEVDDSDRPIGLALYMNFDPDNIYGDGGADNWELTFPHYVKGNYDKIGKCTISYIYTSQGTPSLFLSGNKDYPNMDWHSNGNDFTYFSDLDYCAYGNSNNAVMGYETLNDGSLCILKEDKMKEPTIYFRRGEMVDATDFQGNVVVDRNGNALKEIVYPVTIGNIGLGLINSKSFVQFGNEPVFLSHNGLNAIVLGSQTTANVKFSEERSRLISKKLKNVDLANCPTAVVGDKYFISDVENNTIYVADRKYIVPPSDNLNEEQYEWWVIGDIKAENMFSFKNELYFYDNETLYKFEEGQYTDDKILFTNAKVIGDSTKHTISFVSLNDQFYVSQIEDIKNDVMVYINNKGSVKFSYVDSPDEFVDLDKFIIIYESGLSTFGVRHPDTFERLQFEMLNIPSGASYVSAYIVEKKPVEAYYLTKPINFGTNLHSKCVYYYAFILEVNNESELNVQASTYTDYVNNFTQNASSSNSNVFTDNFDTFKFSLRDFTNYKIAHKKFRNINSIRFNFFNYGTTNCVINDIQLEYTIGFKNKGGM